MCPHSYKDWGHIYKYTRIIIPDTCINFQNLYMVIKSIFRRMCPHSYKDWGHIYKYVPVTIAESNWVKKEGKLHIGIGMIIGQSPSHMAFAAGLTPQRSDRAFNCPHPLL